MPLDGLSSSAQLTENSRCGIIIGMIERILNRNLKGISVRVLRYARKMASPVASTEELKTKMTVLSSPRAARDRYRPRCTCQRERPERGQPLGEAPEREHHDRAHGEEPDDCDQEVRQPGSRAVHGRRLSEGNQQAVRRVESEIDGVADLDIRIRVDPGEQQLVPDANFRLVGFADEDLGIDAAVHRVVSARLSLCDMDEFRPDAQRDFGSGRDVAALARDDAEPAFNDRAVACLGPQARLRPGWPDR